MQYAELRCKTNHSFLTGASHPAELVERAQQLGLSALAITDRDGVYGIPKAYLATRKSALPCPKLIVGAELTLATSEGTVSAISLLAQDRQAYGLLCRMITACHAGKPKGEAKLTMGEFASLMRLNGNKGLIAMPLNTIDPQTYPHVDISAFREMFNDRLFIPLVRLLDGWDRKRHDTAVDLARRYNAPIIATNDVHYHVPERRKLQDVATAIRKGVTFKTAGRQLFSNAERHMKSPAEMTALFRHMPAAIAATLEVAQRCTFSPAELRYRYPSEWIPVGETAQSYLERLTRQGIQARYPGGVPENISKQIEHELRIIGHLNYADYFLTIWEIVEFARGRGILCQGRGSAANSVVCYSLGITAIDPGCINLLFERFMSKERGEPPDIDVDFEHERREEVIQHIYEKYGRDRAGMVTAVICYRSRSSIREVSKVLDVDLEKAKTEQTREAILARELADELYGFPRHLSIHSGGFTLSADPIIETVPIEPARMDGRTIVQWDKDDLDALGLLKVDILALGMLTAIKKCCDSVGLTLATIEKEDPKVYEMIQKADTVGVFQIESRAQMNMSGRLLPKNFYDLVVQIAIVRPGPIVGKMVHPFLKRRRNGLEPNAIPHKKLEPILSKTLGVPIFQEQVMAMAIELANFTPGEADELRRAIGAWRSSGSIEKMGRRLMVGLLASGLPQAYVDQVFEQIKGFSEYGFPESHSASFALLAYAASYLKLYYPAQFTCALLNSQPLQLGLRIASGLSRHDGDALLAERAKRTFDGLADFLARVRLPPNVLHRLAMGDAFLPFGFDQRHALWEILAHEALTRPDPTGQLNLFSGVSIQEQAGIFAQLDESQAIRADYDTYRLSTRGHPMTALRAQMPHLPRLTTEQAKQSPNGRMVTFAGLTIVRQRPPTAAGTVFATLEDDAGFLDLVLHKDTHEKYRELFATQSFMLVRGLIQRDGYSVSMLVRSLKPIWKDDELSDQLERQSRNWR
ncbi:MAG: error-prone DNA polymerase [Deltaproteobacteria bacterium]|nr:error-prone DNA polymerase [Deltaproteobacteria bacterium]